MAAEDRICDIAIIGAGLAGTSAATVLNQAGYDVALVDTRAACPPEFRAEKLGKSQMDQFDRLGLGASARAVTTPVDEICVVRFGTLVQQEARREYGFAYSDLVNRLRGDVSRAVPLTVGRVEGLESSGTRKILTLKDGRRISARLVVVATGLGDTIRRRFGISHDVVSPRHSLSIGFNMLAPRSAFPFEAMTYFAEGFGEGMAYLSLFPLGSAMRGNLFVYRELSDAWTKAFCADPSEGLRTLLPKLSRHCPSLAVGGRVEARPIEIVKVVDPARDGIVLIGDACLTPCPIPGTGIGKVLTDVERLSSVYIPQWLAMPSIDRAAVASFYADPVKLASDEGSLRASLYARAIGTQTGLPWAARRGRNFVARHVLHALGAAKSHAGQRRAPVPQTHFGP